MEERNNAVHADREINFGEYLSVLRSVWWKIALFSILVGAVTLLVMLRMPNIYQATAVITAEKDERRQNPSLGALASMGVDVGGPSRVEDLESLFKSNDLAVRVFQKYDLWPIVRPEKFGPKTGKMKPGWLDGLFGTRQEGKPPGEWDAIRAAMSGLVVATNRKSGSLSLSFKSPSAEGSARIVRYYLDEAKSRLQEEAFERAAKNKKFIEEQIGRTVDALTRDRLYSLYGQEVEREMLARNREQFGFRVIDSPRVPDRKSGPKRARSAVTATLVAAFALCALFVLRGKKEG